MTEGISGPFVRRPIATSLLMAAVLLFGAIAYPLLPIAPLPQVDFPTIQVNANFPGASPETMASSVAQPLERQFAEIPGLSQLTSTSSLGSTSIVAQFELNRSIDAAAQDIQAAINAAGGQLPKDLPSPPTYRKVNPADTPILLLGVNSDTVPLTEVSDAADTKLAQQISQIPGVSQVNIGGQQKPAVRVQVDPARLAAMGLSLEDVRAKLMVSTVDSPKGSINTEAHNFTIYDNDQLTTAKPWNDVIIAYRNGAPIRISDIGRAIDGPEDNYQAAWQDGKRGVFLIIYKQPGANVIDTVDRIKKELPRLQLAIPPAIHTTILSDRTETIRASVQDVQFTLMLTVALVVLVIFLFLRSLWATVIPSLTVPLALTGTFSLMYLVGYSLDNLSLMALTIAVGFVVDDAIVMLENIVRHIEDGMRPLDAAIKGAKEISFTIISISVSLMAVFIPLLMMSGVVGRLFREFSVTICMTIIVSAIVSLTLTPTMGALFLKPEHGIRHGWFYITVENFFDHLFNGYQRGLDIVLKHQFITLLVFLATVATSGYLFVIIPKGFFPQQDTGLIFGMSEGAQDISFSRMKHIQEEFGEIVGKDPDVESYAMHVGSLGASSANTGHVFVSLKPRDERTASATDIINRLRPQLAKIEGAKFYLQAAQDINVGGRSARTQYQYTLQDANLDELNEWAPKMLNKLRTIPQLQDVATDQQTDGATLTLQIDRDKASRYGLDPQVIDDTLYDAFGQRQVTQYFTQLNSYHVILEVTPSLQADPDTLHDIFIKSPTTGQQVPLASFAHWSTHPVAPLAINHQGQFPAVTLSFNLAPGVSLGEATTLVQKAEREIDMPGSLIGTFQGNAQAFQDSLATEPYLIALALITVYIILGILYESYIHPLTILSTLPAAGAGAIAILMLAGFDFSIIGLIGIVLLIGIVKKNGIMMVDFALNAERQQKLSSVEAIRQACLLRFRPIMMTTMAAVLGGVPLMLGHGTGSEMRQPLGYAIVGGLIVSQALTLFTTPVVYIYLDRLSLFLNRLRGKGHHQQHRVHEPAE